MWRSSDWYQLTAEEHIAIGENSLLLISYVILVTARLAVVGADSIK